MQVGKGVSEEGGRARSYLDRELPSVPDLRQDLDFHVKIKLPGPELMAMELLSNGASWPQDH